MEELEIYIHTSHDGNEIRKVSFEVLNERPQNVSKKGYTFYNDNPLDELGVGLFIYNGTNWVNVFTEYKHFKRTDNVAVFDIDIDNTINPNNTISIIKKLTITDEGHIKDIEFIDIDYNHVGAAKAMHKHNTDDIIFNSPDRLLGSANDGTTFELSADNVLTFLSIAKGEIGDLINYNQLDNPHRVWTASTIIEYVSSVVGQQITGALIYQNTGYNGQANPGTLILPIPEGGPTIPIDKGMVWVVSTNGFFGTEIVEGGDMIIALVDNATNDVDFQVINKNITLVDATSLISGIVKLFSDTIQTEDANGVTSTSGRTYGIQTNSSGQLVVNVPWTDNDGELTIGTPTGLTATGTFAANQSSNTTITLSYDTGYQGYTTAEANKLAGIENNANNYTLPTATDMILGGVKLFSNTNQTVVANGITSEATRTYGIQTNASGQLVVNVPWVDTNTNTTYTAGTGITLTGTTFSHTAHTGDVTGSTALTIANNVVTFAKMQNIATQRLLGRGTASSGNIEEITLGSGISLSTAGVLSATGNGGTVTSVAMSVPTGLTVSGSPITSSGTLTLGFASGYSLPTITKQGNWDTAFNKTIKAVAVTGNTTKTITLTREDDTILTANWTDYSVDTITRLRGTTTGAYTSGDLTLLAGTNVTISQSGSNFTIGSIDTTYTGGTGISISGTTIINDAPNITQVLSLSGNILTLSNGGSSVTLPTAGNGSLTIGTPTGLSSSGTFTANQSGNSTITLAYGTGYQGYTTAEATKLAGIEANANNYTLPTATATVLGGVKLFSNTNQTVVANGITSTADRTYGVQTNASGQLVVNVPWEDNNTNTTYTGSTSISLVSGSFQRAALTGDVTAAQNSNATTIANNAVTFTKMQNIATQRLLGRGTAGTGNIEELTLGTGLALSTTGVLSATGSGGTVTSVGLTIAGNALNTNTATITNSGTFGLTWGGTAAQYVNGQGTLVTFPAIPTAGDGSLTIGTPTGLSSSGTFTANQSGNSTISLAYTTGYQGYTTAEATKLAGIAANANNYTLPTATDTVLGGVKLFSNTNQTVAANTITTNASRTYGIQTNASGQLVVNVPWEDNNTNTTYSAGTGITLSGTTFSHTAHTGDVTGSTALTIANNAVTFVKMQNIATQRLLGRGTAGAGNIEELTLGSGLVLSTTGVLSATGSGGTVTSVAMSVPTGLTVTGSPITSSGTLAVGFASGYSLPTTAKQGQWDAAYGWGNHAGLYSLLNHTHVTSNVTALTGYTLGTNTALTATMSLNTALGNLQAQINAKTSNSGTVTSVGLTIAGNALNTNTATITSSGTFGLTWGGTAAQYVNGQGNLVTFPSVGSGSVTSVDMTVAGTALNVSGSPITTSGTLALTWGGTTAQYVRGDGSLATYVNTTYSVIPINELNTGTATTGRLVSAAVLNQWIDSKGYLTSYINTVTRIRGTASGTYTSGDLTLLAGSNVSISQSGSNITINATNTNTTYTGGTGISISGTTINNTAPNITQVLSLSGSTLTLSNGGGSVTLPSGGGTYTAGNGLTLTGTTFGQAITTSGSGTYVQSITQTTSGFQVNLGTPPNTNTTYSDMAIAELNTGTVTTGRIISASVLNQWLNAKGFSTQTLTAGTNISISGNVISATNTNTVTRLRATTSGTYTSGDLTLLAGANTTITQSGASITIASTNTNTTYSAGTGLSLSGTTFGQAITTSGTGTYVQSITQTTSGFQVNLGTPPNTNTTYSNMSIAELNTGTVTTGRIISASVLNQWLNAKGYLTSYTNTVTRLRGTASGTYTSGDLTLLAGSNVSISQSGSNITINATNTNTTYTGGTGISISGTTINNTAPNITQVLSLSGSTLTLSNGGGSVTLPSGGSYSAGNGLTLTGTTFSQTITTTGTGTFVQSITQTANGFQLNMVTPPNFNTVTSIGVNSNNYTNGNINLIPGSNMSITKSGNNITFNSTGGGGGTMGQISTDSSYSNGQSVNVGTVKMRFHEHAGLPPTRFDDPRHVGNMFAYAVGSGTMDFYGSYDNVQTIQVQYGENVVDVDTKMNHITNVVGPTDGLTVHISDGIYAGDQININILHGYQINLHGNILSANGNEVKTFCNLIWDLDIQRWVVVAHG